MPQLYKILIVDDDIAFCNSTKNILSKKGYSAECAHSGESALEALASDQNLRLVLLDYRIPAMDGLEILTKIKDTRPDLTVILITGDGTIESAVTAMKQGAEDYLLKPVEPEKLLAIVKKDVRVWDLEKKTEFFIAELCDKHDLNHIIGESPLMTAVFEKVRNVACTDASVLITGESGTGKELIACAIHYASSRTKKPMTTVNCATLPSHLIESELFGHIKGAYTGAVEDRTGRIEATDEGTLFLDEIGDLPLSTQAKFLRVLETGEFERLGRNETQRADFRLISATNQDLSKAVNDGTFRKDLLYRLKVVEIEIPPLRQKTEDIPLLVNYFLEFFSEKTGKRIIGSTDEVMNLFMSHSWPGNVRELKHVIESAFVYCNSKTFEVQHLPNDIRSPKSVTRDSGALPTCDIEELERRAIELSLKKANGNKTQAAKLLGIHRNSLNSKLARYNIEG